MSIDKDDIRAAVASGIVTEAQAASIVSLAERRSGVRENMDGLDEPFELFRGFNEVFIVVGLGILYLGWLGLTGISSLSMDGGSSYVVYGAISMIVTIWLARYFTVKRRMVAPSIMLVIFFGIGGIQIGSSIANGLDLTVASSIALTAGVATLALIGFYWLYRIPITMLFISIGVFAATGALFMMSGVTEPSVTDLFLLSNGGPFSLITIGLGLIGLIVALRFDMSDPHRVTRRSAAGFWLHVIAAPAIVNTVALTLIKIDSTASLIGLLLFLTVMAVFAIVIDRRSFLVAGVGYVVSLAALVLQGGAALAILALGIGLVLLGAQWEALRARIMTALPDFPAKDKLPPYGLTET